ncbi:hypothetical protein FRB94_011103 [Tulasnella sp. JGI-2019a]|nr:hypothetical protein FRB93_006106 [Tulasnella sp. JGI-2019a]KAG8993015.1 hypothetical protein FRB94_011103 [Tulasnella sp. JGI-2019a]KAG9025423.1 hypothetical protein FRB95_010194 [Tulasnella sp. JGI-2019a]
MPGLPPAIRRQALSARSTKALTRPISTTIGRRAADHGHGAHAEAAHHHEEFNQPSGHLFGEKPLGPGEKRKREDWEMIWYIGMFGSMAVAAVGLYYKPDTSIQTWALKEARQRLEARGDDFEYKPSTSSSQTAPQTTHPH